MFPGLLHEAPSPCPIFHPGAGGVPSTLEEGPVPPLVPALQRRAGAQVLTVRDPIHRLRSSPADTASPGMPDPFPLVLVLAVPLQRPLFCQRTMWLTPSLCNLPSKATLSETPSLITASTLGTPLQGHCAPQGPLFCLPCLCNYPPPDSVTSESHLARSGERTGHSGEGVSAPCCCWEQGEGDLGWVLEASEGLLPPTSERG